MRSEPSGSAATQSRRGTTVGLHPGGVAPVWPAVQQYSSLYTDHYELTMLDAALASSMVDRRAIFEVFARDLAPGRRFGVVAGTRRLVDAIAAFRFGPEELAFLDGHRIVSPATLDWLAGYRFSGDIWGYREGECYFPQSPVLGIEGSFGEAVLLETLVLSILSFDSAIASAATRIVTAARGRPVTEMGSRRTNEEAAVAAARAAYLAGFAATSNLEAGRRFGIPTAGTASHAFILAYRDEAAAFDAQLRALGTGTTLLVDTYDIYHAIRSAVRLARAHGASGPGGIRIDSGDLGSQAREARALLDSLGATSTQIVATSDLDEFSIERLQDAPIDAYGVGTQLVTGSGVPTSGFVYKLVAIARDDGTRAPLMPVAKHSPGKETTGGPKRAWRLFGPDGCAIRELVVAEASAPLQATGKGLPCAAQGHRRALQTQFMQNGEADRSTSNEEIRTHHQAVLAELPREALALQQGGPALAVELDGPR